MVFRPLGGYVAVFELQFFSFMVIFANFAEVQPSVCWAMERDCFKRLMTTLTDQKMQSYDSFLKKVLFTILQGVKNIVFFCRCCFAKFPFFLSCSCC